MSRTSVRWLIAPLLLAGSAAWSAGNPQESWIVRCGGPYQLCGYVEREGGEEHIPQQFEVAERFSEGMAVVRIDGRYGYIDTAGKVVIRPQFEAAGPFTEGFAEIRSKGKSGAIDRAGRMVVPPQFGRLVPFVGGTFVAIPAPAEEPAQAAREGSLASFSDVFTFIGFGGAGLYNLHRGWLTPTDLNFSFFDQPSRGLIWAGRRNSEHDDEWGLMRSDGTWQVTPRFNHVQRLSETHAVVGSMPDYSLPARERRDSTLVGAVDRDGKLVVPLARRGLSYWRGGYGLARDRSPGDGPKEGIATADGSLLGGRFFDEVDIAHNREHLPRGRVGKSWFSIKADGTLIPDELEGTPLVECPSGLKILRRGDGVEFQGAGQATQGSLFENSYFSARDCPGPFAAKRNGKWFVVLEDGKVLGEPRGFDNSYFFGKQYGAVQVAGKWGVIDRSGKFTVKPIFPRLRPAGPDIYAVGEGKAMRWIDARGRPAKKPDYPRPSREQALTCPGGLRFFSASGLWGLQDADGKVVIEARYRALSCFVTGVTWAALPDAHQWCPFGPDGSRREALDCRTSFYPMRVTHHWPERFSDDAYESSVLWTRAWLDHLAGIRAEGPKWIAEDGGPASYSVMPAR